MNASGNSILITGGATGIGLELARLLVDRGNKVMICGRRRDRLQAARAQLPGIDIRVCDITRPGSRRSLVAWLRDASRRPNILINNAGIQVPTDFLAGARDLDAVDAQVATNLIAPMHLTGMLVPMLRRKRSAAIVNISSGLGFAPKAEVAVYSATKAAIHSWSQSLRHQLRKTSIRVFEIVPPLVATALQGERRQAAGGVVMTPEAVAEGTIQALEIDEFEIGFGTAAGAMLKRDALFPMINPE